MTHVKFLHFSFLTKIYSTEFLFNINDQSNSNQNKIMIN